jgi:hypothetical protein
MWRAIRKVTNPPLLFQAFDSIFTKLIISALVALTAQLEAADKVLTEEKAARLVKAAEGLREVIEGRGVERESNQILL